MYGDMKRLSITGAVTYDRHYKKRRLPNKRDSTILEYLVVTLTRAHTCEANFRMTRDGGVSMNKPSVKLATLNKDIIGDN